jgi:hypothetical protein
MVGINANNSSLHRRNKILFVAGGLMTLAGLWTLSFATAWYTTYLSEYGELCGRQFTLMAEHEVCRHPVYVVCVGYTLLIVGAGGASTGLFYRLKQRN